ncbi:hypothetical protein [Actinomadura rudentiformis]|uniref:Uncharacterized protein n=1 Tax=Actinomadura rudentiformis TaxID=359158 RepID=A0A6H9YK51_9ACTN|nr:hypothetical protein [Actinomadura rudentiformis]KAB2344793.1 hypothetical protein F8566_29775 [Actinomadura rudentiformis]
MDEKSPLGDADLNTVLPIITTEHFNLQSVRSSTTSEAVGRASMFLGTVSTALVALSFAGQVTDFGGSFAVFGAVTFLSLFFLGVVTFDRTLQVSIEDVQAARRMNRLRRLYFELAPGLADYMAPPAVSDEAGEVLRSSGMRVARGQMLLTVAGMVSVVNSIILSVLVGMLVARLDPDLMWLAVSLGAVVFVGSVMLHERIQRVRRTEAHRSVP